MVDNIKIERLRAERDQLWAEASIVEASGISLALPEELLDAATAEQNARLEVDLWEEKLCNIAPSHRCDNFRGEDGRVYSGEAIGNDDILNILGIPPERQHGGVYKRVRTIMRRNWIEGRGTFGGRERRRGYLLAKSADS